MRHDDDALHLVIPEKSLELGLKLTSAEPLDHDERKVFRSTTILPVKILHVQALIIRGLRRTFRAVFQSDGKSSIALLFAEPYSITAIWLFVSLKLAFIRPSPRVVLYALQNIRKQDPLPLRLIEKYLYRRVDAICSLGAEQTQVLRDKGYKGMIIDFPLWYDTSVFFPGDAVFGGRIKVGYAGSFTEEKGLSDLNEALSTLPIEDEICFFAAGSGPFQFDIKNPKVNFEPAAHLGLEGMGRFFRSLDLLIVPSRTTPHWKEQFGRVIIEAKACGVTVLGSNSGAIPHLINDDERIFNEQDPESLRQFLHHWIEKLREDSPFRQAVRLVNAASVAEKYSAKACAEKFARHLEDLVPMRI